MKGTNGVKFIVVMAVIAVLTYIAFFGNFLGLKVPGITSINLGIDVRGGVRAQLAGEKLNGGKPSNDDLDSAKAKIDTRLDSLGISDRTTTVDYTNGRILVEIPWLSNEKDYNPQKTIDQTIQTALLTFREVDPKKVDENGDYLPLDDKIILQGPDIKNAKAQFASSKGTYDVLLTLSQEGSKKFSVATGRLVGKPIAIFMDNKMISAPVVQSQINTTSAVIEMNNTTKTAAKEAKDLADKIRGGALPIKLKAIQINSISPLLGMNALQKSIWAGIIAICVVWVFMLIYYRLPGLIADLGLFAFAVINLLALAWIPFTNLTLPGIAGVILSVGMAVDANVIIFERIKEELKSGKTLKTSIDMGFKRAMTAIIDSNLTTVIAAVVLWIFGEGPIKGFAYTLGLGVMVSFLTAITICRILITTISNLNIAKNHWLYGA